MGERRKRTQPGIIKVKTTKKNPDLKICDNMIDNRFKCYRTADKLVTIEHPDPKRTEFYMCNQCFDYQLRNNPRFMSIVTGHFEVSKLKIKKK